MPATPTPSDLARQRRQLALDRPLASSQDFPEAHVERIEHSHERCAALGLSRVARPDLAPLGRADLAVVRGRQQRLHAHAAPVMELLFDQIAGTQSMVVLCDDTGTVIHSVGDDDFLSRASKVALQPGVNWSEPAKGTNAIGTALIEESPTLVHADEHYMHANHFLTCSAAPIMDPRGNVLEVLDVTGDHRSYHQHTMALVTLSARMIENQWLADHFRHAMRLHFHTRPAFIGTLMEGILAVSPEGRLLGANRSALEQLGVSGAALRMQGVQSLFGVSVGALVDRFRSSPDTPAPLHTAGGRTIYVQARVDGRRWGEVRTPAASMAPLVDAAPTVARAIEGPTRGPAVDAGPATVPPGLASLDTGDRQMKALIDTVRRVRDRDIPILIVGETGTGKALLARAIHQDSWRRDRPFVVVHCACLPEKLLEAELFGAEESGHLGARGRAAAGKILQADGGTLFLDEIGDLPPSLQARLLHVLQERRVTPPGGTCPVPVDLAIVCASQRHPRDLIDSQAFRQDLYDRLAGLAVRLPPLRDRSDLEALVRRLLDADPASQHLRLSSPAVSALQACHWPGNVRQLHNVLRTAAALAGDGPLIGVDQLPEEVLEDGPCASAGAAGRPAAAGGEATPSLEALEMMAIRQALEAAGGNLSLASRRLGISRNTIYRKLRRRPDGA